MSASAIVIVTLFIYLFVAGAYCFRLKGLLSSGTKAPYAILLALGLILQVVTYVLMILHFGFLAFLPSNRRIAPLASISTGLFQLLPIVLVLCTVRALHGRLSALGAARPQAQERRFKFARYGDWFQLALLAVAFVLLSLVNELGKLLHALVFMTSTCSILVFSRGMNGFLLLPDKVLLAINTRIVPLFLFRSSYTVIDAILPLIDPKIRIFTPSFTISADGFIWLIVFYNLLGLAHPSDNWVGQDSAHLAHGTVEEGQSTTTQPASN